jgi:lipopolysaccharide/colanic/teichoic acid biosynthesis glycosyltransferase
MTRAGLNVIDWGPRSEAAAAPDAPRDSAFGPAFTWRAAAYRVAKRGLDVVLALVLLACTCPLMLAVAVAIKCTSRGPVLFRQARAGVGGHPFLMLKFRSMRINACEQQPFLADRNELQGPVFKIRNDPRFTPIGRFLRRTSIDELPQLWNVIRGDMSLVGPRPLPLDEVRTQSTAESGRLSVLPGLTCLWQISGRCDIPYREWMQLDLFYVRHRSLLLDVEILLRTIPAVLSGRGAY